VVAVLVHSILSPIGASRGARLLLRSSWIGMTHGFAMGHDIQVLDRDVSRVDRSIHRGFRVKPKHVEPAPTQEQESKHRHDAIAQCCGWSGYKARVVHGSNVRAYR
jgi:hypothetical protein